MAPQDAQPTAPQPLEVQFRLPGIALVQLRGEHDLSGKEALAEALASASDQLNVLVDLSECTFMDSSVLGVLIPAGQTSSSEAAGSSSSSLPKRPRPAVSR